MHNEVLLVACRLIIPIGCICLHILALECLCYYRYVGVCQFSQGYDVIALILVAYACWVCKRPGDGEAEDVPLIAVDCK